MNPFDSLEPKSAKPYGLSFAEEAGIPEVPPTLSLEYDEDGDYTVVSQNGCQTPLVKTGTSYLRTITITEQKEEPDNGGDEDIPNLEVFLLTITATKTTPENPDDGDDDQHDSVYLRTNGRNW